MRCFTTPLLTLLCRGNEILVKLMRLIINRAEVERFEEKFMIPQQVYLVTIQKRHKYGAIKGDIVFRRKCWKGKLLLTLDIAEREIELTDPEAGTGNIYTCYVSINPRNQYRVAYELNDFLSKVGWFREESSMQMLVRIDSKWLSIMAKCPHKLFIDLDVDNCNYLKPLNKELKAFGCKPTLIVSTHSGYHYVINRGDLKLKRDDLLQIDEKNKAVTLGEYLFKEVNNLPKDTKYNVKGEEYTDKPISVLTDSLLPIVGTNQGGVTVREVEDMEEEIRWKMD